jgi:histidinol-phosphate/aromatic aminotransferase/cobyric acid decarboxylase-like protein
VNDPRGMTENVARVDADRDRLAAALSGPPWWDVGAVGDELFLLVDFGTPERAAAAATGMLRRGIVPDGRSRRAIRSPTCLRLTNPWDVRATTG